MDACAAAQDVELVAAFQKAHDPTSTMLPRDALHGAGAGSMWGLSLSRSYVSYVSLIIFFFVLSHMNEMLS